jgi:octaprenyl-diphosphate synthase
VSLMDTDILMKAIGADAARVDQAMREDLGSLQPGADPLLLEILEYGLLNGGKRIRPLLVVLSARLCGCGEENVYRLAIAFEYLHAATLFHDDVIDNAETRRGRPAVNKQFGQVAAILAGDFLHARSMGIVGQLAGSRGLEIFCMATAGMVDGEFRQLRNASRQSISEDEYHEIVMGKTGFLIAAACEIGGLFAGGTEKQQLALRRYGAGLGTAFQMIDDILDYLGDTRKTGKSVGNDLNEGKLTLPVIIALQKGRAADVCRLREILAMKGERSQHFSEVVDLVLRYEGFTETRKRAESSITEALRQLRVFSDQTGNTTDKRIFEVIAQYVLHREK